MERKNAEPMTPREKLGSTMGHPIPFAASAEQLGFMEAPEPECLGRPDSPCNHDHHMHDHAHARPHGHHEHDHPHDHDTHDHPHDHGGHDHPREDEEPPEEEGHEESHEHMRVFPVFELDEQGRIIEMVNEQGQISASARRRLVKQREEEREADVNEGEKQAGEHGEVNEEPPTPRKRRKKG